VLNCGKQLELPVGKIAEAKAPLSSIADTVGVESPNPYEKI